MSILAQKDLLDYGYVRFVESWGSDQRIIEAARMSTDKGFQGWGPRCPDCGEVVVLGEPSCAKCGSVSTRVPGDEKLLRYLWKNKHYTPFEMAGMTIEVQAPIFVFREWHRHRTQSYNELSARYTPLPDLFYLPSEERVMMGKQSTTNKQSSETATFLPSEVQRIRELIDLQNRDARRTYDELLGMGVAREVARVVIPVAQYSRMRASANLRNWLHFLSLRNHPAAQWEIQQYAKAVADMLEILFPRTSALYLEEK